jgi:hypothetical protein
MAEKYFQRFPRVTYSDYRAIDITKRVKLLDTVSNNPFVFYSYDIGDSERADSFSSRYYNDSYMSWLLYISNDIIDPYYEWYLSAEELEGLVEKKYGSLADAKLKIKHYRNNWENQEDITISDFSNLNEEKQTYWTPVYNNGVLYSYTRKQEDWIASTNKIVSYTVSNTSFIDDELCDIVFDTGVIGRGQVVQSSNNNVYIKNVSGSFDEDVTANSYIYGRESTVNTSFTAVSVISQTISSNVESYYTPISYFDYEYEKNEFNRTIRVIDSEYKYLAVENLRDLLEQ